MRLIPPRQTDVIAALASRVSALEGAAYNTNSIVSMFKLFTETPTATDTFTISTHTYHVCGTTTICGPNEIL